jgi:hypothetical protein
MWHKHERKEEAEKRTSVYDAGVCLGAATCAIGQALGINVS